MGAEIEEEGELEHELAATSPSEASNRPFRCTEDSELVSGFGEGGGRRGFL